MTRLFTDGAEFGDTIAYGVTGTIIAATDQKRSGEYSYRLTGSGSNPILQVPFTDTSEIYARFGYRVAAIPSNTSTKVPSWRSSATELGSIRLSSTGKLDIYNSSTNLAVTGDTIINVDTWYLIEVRIKIADSPNGIIQVKIDGVMESEFTGDTQPGSETTIDSINLYGVNTSGEFSWFDDLALNNTAGGVDDSWVGDGHVILLTPNAAGDTTELYFFGGASNYESVDDFPHDTDATYVYGSDLDFLDLYSLTPCGLSDVTIRRVYAESRSRDTVADGGEIALTVKTESTEYDSSDQTLLTTYTRIVGTDHVVNPNTTSAWTTTQLDALQVGPKTRLGP